MSISPLPNTPEAALPELQTLGNSPKKKTEFSDIWILCSICQQHIHLHFYFYHKFQHKAQAELGYKKSESPTSIEGLSTRRKQAIAHINNHLDYKQRIIHNINRSYEILKGHLVNSEEIVIKCHSQVCGQVYQMDIQNNIIRSIAVCSHENPFWQRDMEDYFTVSGSYGSRSNTCFVGVFDGFHGKSAACTMSSTFPILFLDQLLNVDQSYQISDKERHFMDSFETIFNDQYKELEKNIFSSVCKESSRDSYLKLIHAAYANAFWRMEKILKLGREEKSKSRWSGCTSVTCLIDGFTKEDTSQDVKLLDSKDQPIEKHKKKMLGMLHVANIGNIKAVLCKNGKSHCLTKTHSTSSSTERKRLREVGGTLSSNKDWGLVESVNEATRLLGHHGDPKLKKPAIPAPYTLSVPVYKNFQFLILASGGLWKVFSDNEVVAIAMEDLKDLLKYTSSLTSDLNTTENMQRSLVETNKIEEDMYIHKPIKDSCKLLASQRQNDSEDNKESDNPEEPSKVKTNLNPDTFSRNQDFVLKNSQKLYDNAAAYVCEHLVQAAILAGSQENVTVCLILLPGCEEISSKEESPN